MSDLKLLELLPGGHRREWSFGHHDVYHLAMAARIGSGGTMMETALMLPLRITAAILFRDLPPLPPEGEYTPLASDSDDLVPWKNLREL